MNEIAKRLENLERLVEKHRSKASNSLKLTAIIYAILIIFVFGYTTYLRSMIVTTVTPQNIAALALEQAQQKLPEINEMMMEQGERQADMLIDQVVARSHQAIPQLTELAKGYVETTAMDMVERLKKKFLPKLVENIDETFEENMKFSKDLTDKQVARGMAAVLVEYLDKEMEKILNENVYNQIDYVREEIDMLVSKPPARMNKREMAEKRLLMNWLFLLENANTGVEGGGYVSHGVRLISLPLDAMPGFVEMLDQPGVLVPEEDAIVED